MESQQIIGSNKHERKKKLRFLKAVCKKNKKQTFYLRMNFRRAKPVAYNAFALGVRCRCQRAVIYLQDKIFS